MNLDEPARYGKADETTIVERCAAAVCLMCNNPRWNHANKNEDGYYHTPINRRGDSRWCDATLIWWEFEDDKHE